MGLIKTTFKRKSGFRDARLIVLACEGSKTEPRYFQALRAIYQKSAIQVEILDRKSVGIAETNSAAKHVIEVLNRFKKKYKLTKEDELWLLLDRDEGNFSEAQLSETARLCTQKKYNLAISNPTFELWLLLHFENIAEIEQKEQAIILKNEKISSHKKHIEKRIEQHLNGYNKATFSTDFLMEKSKIEAAIRHAKLFPLEEGNRWHNGLGTNVHLVVEKII